MELVDALRRWTRLAGLLGMAAGSLMVQACTRASPGGRDGSVDAAVPPDAAVDARIEDSGAEDATVSSDAEAVDAQLWDVICE